MTSNKMTTGIIIGLLIIGIFAFLFFRKISNRQKSETNTTNTKSVDQTIPDSPIGFGYKTFWFAVKTNDQQKVAELLKIRNVEKCNWNVGIDKSYNGSVFITSTIDGWTLFCGSELPAGDSKNSIFEVKQILQTLSKEFGESQFFCTHRIVEYHCWMKAIKGKVIRVYVYQGDQGENLAIEGETTDFEKKYKLVNTFSAEAKNENYFENENLLIPDEEFVMKVAENWSVDPSKLEDRKDLTPSLGLIGKL
jgi:hypothetical protein